MRPQLFLALLPCWLGLFLAFESSRFDSTSQTSFTATKSISFSDFAGAETCKNCHAEQYDAWVHSTHGNAGGLPIPETLIAPFDGTPIRFKDAVVIPSVAQNGEYVFTVRPSNARERVFRVDGVIGRGHMVGGGTQGFVTQFPDGTLRFLPFDYSKQGRMWFANTIGKGNKGWVPINDELRLAECSDWPPTRVLGTDRRFSHCQECHGSQISLRFDQNRKKYETHVTSLTIDCESCHGPAKRHVQLARSGRMTDDIGLRSLSTLSKDESLLVCFQCHAVKDVLQQGYLPGSKLERYYSLKLPLLGESHLHPDGRTKTFAYQEGHFFSDCYLNGSMTCVSCHDPHSQGYRDINRNPLPDRFDDRQCTGCHSSKAEAPQRHTFHKEGSDGSRCVACHMPYLQHPEVGKSIRFARSDHTISIPRPVFDEQLGIESACSRCHSSMKPDSLEGIMRRWYGEIKPHPEIVRGLLSAHQSKTLEDAARRVLLPSARHPMAQFAGVSFFLENYLSTDRKEVSAFVLDSLSKLARHSDIDVRAIALSALLLAERKERINSILGEANAQDRDALRRRISLVLGFLGDRERESENPHGAIEFYLKSLEVSPNDADLHLNLAHAYAAAGDYGEAIRHYRMSLDLNPAQSLALVNLGIAYAAQGNMSRAIVTYEQAIEQNPFEPLAYFNLANVYLQANQPQRAIPLYEKAVDLDFGMALGHFYLARAYILTRQYEKALAAVNEGLIFDAQNESANQMRRDLLKALRKE
ncbi:MAG TPA: tetratricopeptide repeat protein [Bacteroidota bacterium]|nr:tetratricopeptide repeat protein [Bacteroidota bacterium]